MESICYSKEVASSNSSEPQYPGSKPRVAGFIPEGARIGPPQGVLTILDNIEHAKRTAGPNSPFLGHRVQKDDGTFSDYVWESYERVFERAKNFGSGLSHLGLRPDDCVGLYSINRPEWIIAENACYYHRFTTVPLYDTLGKVSIEYIVNQTDIKAIVCSPDKKETIFNMAPSLPSLKFIIVMPETAKTKKSLTNSETKPVTSQTSQTSKTSQTSIPATKSETPEKIQPDPKKVENQAETETVGTKSMPATFIPSTDDSAKVVDSNAIVELAKTAPQQETLATHQFEEIEKSGCSNRVTVEANLVTPESIATICYTSGTTGMPKGAVLTHKNILHAASSLMNLSEIGRFPRLSPEDIHISYLPLAHVFERVGIQFFMFAGCRVGFFTGNVLALGQDMQALKPTVFVSVPRLFNRIYEGVMGKIKAKPLVSRSLFNLAYKIKSSNLPRGVLKSALWDKIVFSKIRENFGGNLRFLFSGSAPLNSKVADFLRICFSCPLFEGYGQTESACGLSTVVLPDTMAGHVGSPLPGTEIMLVDVPDLGYTSADKPYPRGEVYARGPQIFNQYFKLPEKTAEALHPGGWLATGDIGQWGPDGRLMLIDRAKSVFKLAQGEYISPETIEETYKSHPLVQSIFVYGDPTRSAVVAILYPECTAFTAWKESAGLLSEQPEEVSKKLATHLGKYVREAGLKGYEVASGLHITAEDFTLMEENKTPTWKLRREVVTKAFGPVIENLYQAQEKATLAPKK